MNKKNSLNIFHIAQLMIRNWLCNMLNGFWSKNLKTNFLTLQIYACVFDWKTVERDDERNRKQPAESVIYA
jgi:hypothetical protein